MKAPLFFAIVLLLPACGITPQNRTWDDLREPGYVRAEQEFPPSFAQIQMALFKHQAACGSWLEFSVDPRRPSYATIVQAPEAGVGADHTIVVDLVLRENRPVRARAYSYYAGPEVDERIRKIFNAIRYPESCSGEPPEETAQPDLK